MYAAREWHGIREAGAHDRQRRGSVELGLSRLFEGPTSLGPIVGIGQIPCEHAAIRTIAHVFTSSAQNHLCHIDQMLLCPVHM